MSNETYMFPYVVVERPISLAPIRAASVVFAYEWTLAHFAKSYVVLIVL